MKMYQVVNVLGAINETGKLASDMYDIGKKRYYSESHGQEIPISEMDFQYLVRAFIKLCEQEDMLDRTEHMGRTRDLVKNLQEQEDKLLELTTKVENLQGMLKERDELLEQAESLAHKERESAENWRKLYYDNASTKGHRYVFSEIPNDEYGKKLTRGMKVYLNNESYTMRVRGQHLKKELYGQGKAYHGANIEDCTHLRVYIDAI